MKLDLGSSSLDATIEVAKAAACRYRQITGKPLGITGEIGEFQAAQLLGLELAEARQAGYDAVSSDGRRVQVKSRCVIGKASPGQRLGAIRLDHEWDTVVLVLMDENFDPIELYEAGRVEVESALAAPGSKSRNERGALGVGKFKSIARLVWHRDTHLNE